MYKNNILKTLTSPGIDLNELIEKQAKVQTGTVPPITHIDNNKPSQSKTAGRVYQKVIPTRRG